MTLEVKDKKKSGKEGPEGAKGDKGPCLEYAFYRWQSFHAIGTFFNKVPK